MDGWSKEKLSKIILDEFRNFHTRAKEIENSIEVSLQKDLDYLRQLILQASNTNSAPLLLKTPKVTRGKLARRIETIHEDETTDFDPISTVETISLDDEEVVVVKNENNDSAIRRSNRNASRKASKSIRALQSIELTDEVKRPSSNQNGKNEHKTEPKKRHKQSTGLSSSDDEVTEPVKQKTTSKKSSLNKNTAGGNKDPINQDETFVVSSTNHAEPKITKKQSSTAKRKFNVTRSPSPCPSNERYTSDSNGPAAKKAHIINDSFEKPNDTLEASVYEDAIGKPAPIHNSTKIGDLTVTVETKLPESAKPLKNASYGNMNATVTLEPLSAKTIKAHLRPTVANSGDEDEVSCTPKVKVQTKNTLLSDNRPIGSKLVHKPNALFSPYATDSVKKRVEAFEQVHLNSPQSADVDAPVRVTRTKTRAMAAATAVVSSVEPTPAVSNVAHKLARKSLAKAKKISLAKQVREQEDDNKENGTLNSAAKPSRIVTYNEKVMQKQQLRITPNPRSRLQPPVSVGRGPTTPLNAQLLSNHTKPISGSRSNIVVNIDSFLPTNKHMQKNNSSENKEEIKRKAADDDARKKRDEALKAVIDEKRRKREEKELKNKLAREAKEKLDMEKRLKAEKEREEKAKLALQMHEKQREEAERKRLLQLQRAQEKEERRKQEEELRLQQLQEQEETERLLADQKRKEQEAEKQHQRRLAEAKAQQRAAAEAARIKALNQAKLQAKQMNNTYDISQPVDGPTSYKMDSEPDDGSDDESAPKHEIPRWARSEVRRRQLKLQEYIPMIEVYKFFGSRQCTPDLSEMFKGIDKRRLVRTSSAIWKKPPRASMLYLEHSS